MKIYSGNSSLRELASETGSLIFTFYKRKKSEQLQITERSERHNYYHNVTFTALPKYSTSTKYAPKLDTIQFLPNSPNPNIPRLQTTERHNFYHNGTLIYSPNTATQPIKLKIPDTIQFFPNGTLLYIKILPENTANPTISKTPQTLTYPDFKQPKAANGTITTTTADSCPLKIHQLHSKTPTIIQFLPNATKP